MAFRNILIHGNATLDYQMVWRVIHESLPTLRVAVNRIGALLQAREKGGHTELARVYGSGPRIKVRGDDSKDRSAFLSAVRVADGSQDSAQRRAGGESVLGLFDVSEVPRDAGGVMRYQ